MTSAADIIEATHRLEANARASGWLDCVIRLGDILLEQPNIGSGDLIRRLRDAAPIPADLSPRKDAK